MYKHTYMIQPLPEKRRATGVDDHTHPTKLVFDSIRGIYTGIEKPRFFLHSSFSLKVARQLPLNSAHKKHLRSVVFWNSAVFSLFFASVNAPSPLASFIQVYGHVARDLPNTVVRSSVKSCLLTTLYQETWMCFSCHKTQKVMGFLWQCNFFCLFFVFLGGCQCKWAYYWYNFGEIQYETRTNVEFS